MNHFMNKYLAVLRFVKESRLPRKHFNKPNLQFYVNVKSS